MNATRMLSRKGTVSAWDMTEVPMKTENEIMATATLATIPIVRIVATMPDAIPRYFLSTEDMMAFVLGDENRA